MSAFPWSSVLSTSHLGHDARPNLPLLSTVERQDRALAQVAEKRVHSAGNAVVAGRCAAPGQGLRGALQQRPPEQCHRLHPAEGRAGGASAGNPRGTRPEAGSRQTAAPESPPASRLKSEAGQPPRCRTAGEVDSFRLADQPPGSLTYRMSSGDWSSFTHPADHASTAPRTWLYRFRDRVLHFEKLRLQTKKGQGHSR